MIPANLILNRTLFISMFNDENLVLSVHANTSIYITDFLKKIIFFSEHLKTHEGKK